MLHPNFVILGALIQFFGSWSYLVDTLKGKVKPNKVSWFLWALAPLIACVAQVQQGIGILALTTFIVGFVPLIIFIASFRNKEAKWEITKLDLICGTLSLLGIILWYTTQVGNVAILFSILADALAAIPTIVKSYYYPETENDSVYLYGVVNASIGLLTIKIWTFEYYGFPLYLLFVTILLVFLIRFKAGLKIQHLLNSTK